MWCGRRATSWRRLGRRHPGVPVIGFPRFAGLLIGEYVRATRVDAVGLDTGMDLALAEIADAVRSGVARQPRSDGAGSSGGAALRSRSYRHPGSNAWLAVRVSIWATASCRRPPRRTWRSWWSKCVRPDGRRARLRWSLFNLGAPDRPAAVRPFLLQPVSRSGHPARAVSGAGLAGAGDRRIFGFGRRGPTMPCWMAVRRCWT